MMATGSSTIWESWSQESASGCSELSMTLWATIDEFFYNDIAGIKGPDFFRQGDFTQAGFKQIVIAPYLPHDMKKVFGSFRTVYGTISSGWEKMDDETVFHISIPANTAATVMLPAASGGTLKESDMVVWQDGMSLIGRNDGVAGRNDAAADEDDAIADNRIGMHDDIRTGIFACGFKENRLEIRIGSGDYCFHLTEV
jgi:alpha-L-rhamnosidase